MIINDNSMVINKLETSLTDDARVINFDRHMFIVQATDVDDPINCCSRHFKLQACLLLQK